MSEELKPCPFCGGEAEHAKDKNALKYTYRVVCTVCGVSTRGTMFSNNCFNASAWNTRANEIEGKQ